MVISILVPVYNVKKYIRRCALSLLSQTDLEDVEFIFVNDCTIDNSIQLLEECLRAHRIAKGQYQIVNHYNNRGLAAARNTGIDYARGDYIVLLDSDDTLEPNTISLLKNEISKNSPDIIVFGMQFVYPNGIRKTVRGNYVPASKDQYLEDVISRKCLVTACGKLYSRRLFEKVRFIEGLNYGEDYATLPRLIHTADSIIDLSSYILYNYYQDNALSYTKSTIGRKQIDNIYKAIDILDDFFERDSTHKGIDKLLRIRNKIFLLEYVDDKFREEILNMYPEYNNADIELPTKHKIVWNLARKRHDKILSFYLKLSQWLKSKIYI